MDSATQSGTIVGTVTDVNDSPVANATVTLEGSDHAGIRSVTTNEGGFFEIRDIAAGNPYQLHIQAVGFKEWDSPVVTLEPGQHRIEDVPQLQIEEVETVVTVTPETTQEMAIEQVKTEEKQRALGGLFPDFYAVYSSTPVPLNDKLRFTLAFRLARDPFTFAGVAFLAGMGQAAGYPAYRQGLEGYGERVGAGYANAFTDMMFTGAVFPSLFRQDPRYYYDGKGSIDSRVLHTLSTLVITRSDTGRLQPNYSGVGGDLAAAAITSLYYPRGDRGTNIILQSFAVNTAIHTAVRLLDEFFFHSAALNREGHAFSGPAGGCANSLASGCN